MSKHKLLLMLFALRQCRDGQYHQFKEKTQAGDAVICYYAVLHLQRFQPNENLKYSLAKWTCFQMFSMIYHNYWILFYLCSKRERSYAMHTHITHTRACWSSCLLLTAAISNFWIIRKPKQNLSTFKMIEYLCCMHLTQKYLSRPQVSFMVNNYHFGTARRPSPWFYGSFQCKNSIVRSHCRIDRYFCNFPYQKIEYCKIYFDAAFCSEFDVLYSVFCYIHMVCGSMWT